MRLKWAILSSAGFSRFRQMVSPSLARRRVPCGSPMPKKNLDPRFVATVKTSKRVTYFDTKEPGLVLRVTPTAKSWWFVYRVKGSRALEWSRLGRPRISRSPRRVVRRSTGAGRYASTDGTRRPSVGPRRRRSKIRRQPRQCPRCSRLRTLRHCTRRSPGGRRRPGRAP